MSKVYILVNLFQIDMLPVFSTEKKPSIIPLGILLVVFVNVF